MIASRTDVFLISTGYYNAGKTHNELKSKSSDSPALQLARLQVLRTNQGLGVGVNSVAVKFMG